MSGEMDAAREFRRQMKAAGPEYSMTPFWFWNGDLDPDELIRQMALMREQGVMAFVIHARKGLEIPYLSEEWFDRVVLVLEEAKRHGMLVWIYDEDNWPSGYAGGRVLQKNPNLTAQCLEFERVWLDEGEDMWVAPAPHNDPKGRGEVVAINAIDVRESIQMVDSPLAWHALGKEFNPAWNDRDFCRVEFGDEERWIEPYAGRAPIDRGVAEPLTEKPTPPAPDAPYEQVRAFADQFSGRTEDREDLYDRMREEYRAIGAWEGSFGELWACLKSHCEVVEWLEAKDDPERTRERRDLLRSLNQKQTEIEPFWRNPGGRWLVTIHRRRTTEWFPAYTSEWYVDVLRPETADLFLRTTHEEYRKRFGEYFGDTLRGFFVDEPGLYNNFWDRNPASVAWTEDFADAFREAKGYDIRRRLYALYEATKWSEQVRFDFYDFVGELMEDRFMRPLADWCEHNGVELTGHLMLEEFMVTMARYAGNPFRQLRHLHIPGVDRIDEAYEKITERLGSSIAHLAGRERCMSETYALIGWKLAPPYMHQIWHHQAARGVNMLCPHAFYYSIEGFRKDECPPSEFFQNPWWPHFKPLADAVREESWALSQGQPVNDFLLYYPLETCYAKITPEWPPAAEAGPTETWQLPSQGHPATRLDHEYTRLVLNLEENGFTFDLVDWTFLAGAEIIPGEPAKLLIGDVETETLVVPFAEVLAPEAAEVISEFAALGGRVILFDCAPHVVGGDEGIEGGFERLPNAPLALTGALRPGGPNINYQQRRSPTARDPKRPIRTTTTHQVFARRDLDGAELRFTTSPISNTNTLFHGSSFFSLGEKRLPNDIPPSGYPHLKMEDGWTVHFEGESEPAWEGRLVNWSEMGRPLYSGRAKYSAELELEADSGWFVLWAFLCETGRLWVNGTDLGPLPFGRCLWHVPEELLREGANTIEIEVANTLQGQLEGVERLSGLLQVWICFEQPEVNGPK